VELLIERLVAGGEGLTRRDGKAVFVPGVLPGEKVRARIIEQRRDYDRAAPMEILSPSPHRQAPPCGLAGICGGCDWLHIAYPQQLALKVGIVREALTRAGGADPGTLEIEAGPPLEYRNRVQLHRGPAGSLGFMGARSTRVVAASRCPVSVTEINQVLAGAPAGPGPRRFIVYGASGRAYQEGRDDGEGITVRVGGRDIRFAVSCFFQGNLAVLEKLVDHVVEGLAQAAPLTLGADLYCGVGLFAAHVAHRFQRFTAVESDARSLEWARRNVASGTCEFHAATVESWITGARPSGLDAVIVDPPRAGLSGPVREWLLSRPVRLLTYVSCNPATLARDLAALAAGGYRVQGMRLFDFFPQTSHVEAVARLAHTDRERA
jgi:23S rRNA (uracil1939-C5)-methyltransferase